jgi:hypothetical protein
VSGTRATTAGRLPAALARTQSRLQRPGAPRWVRPPVRVGALCLAVAVAVNALLVHEIGRSGDEPYYARIAAHPSGPHNFPYAFRIGVPYLVHVLPFPRSFSWALIALLAAGIAAGALFALLRDFGVGPRLSTALAVGFVISPPLLVTFLRNGISVDPASVMVITLGTLFILRRHLVALGLTLLIGTTIHEPCLFLIPFAYAVWAERLIDPRALRDLALVAVLPALLYVYLRATIIAVGEGDQPGYYGPFLTERIDVVKLALGNGGWLRELRRLVLDYGPLWIAAAVALPRLRFAQRGLVLLALCIGSMTFALDWGRAAFFAAPVVYVAAGWVLRDRRRLAVAAVACLLLVDGGYALYMQVHGVRYGLDAAGPPARGPVS